MMPRAATTLLFLSLPLNVDAWAGDRRAWLQRAASAAALAGVAASPPFVARVNAADVRLDDRTLLTTVTADILERQFLATGDITRSIYEPTATFTDEIDTYQLDQWVKGTQRLFVGRQSEVRLVGDVSVQPDKVEFRFDEDLMFNIPFRPVVSLTGRVELLRNAETGRISSYQEFWDQDVLTVLKSAKFKK